MGVICRRMFCPRCPMYISRGIVFHVNAVVVHERGKGARVSAGNDGNPSSRILFVSKFLFQTSVLCGDIEKQTGLIIKLAICACVSLFCARTGWKSGDATSCQGSGGCAPRRGKTMLATGALFSLPSTEWNVRLHRALSAVVLV